VTADQQRQRLYAAEDTPTRATLPTVAEAQAYTDKVLGRAYLRRKYAFLLPRKVTVLDGRMRRSACASHTFEHGPVIRLPRWSRSEQVILHELAHHITWGSRDGDHGPTFATVYLDLVRHMLGAEAAARLQARYRVHGVRVLDKGGKPRLPQVPPAQASYAAERKAGLAENKAWRLLMQDWSQRFRTAAENGGEVDCPSCGEWATTKHESGPYQRRTVEHVFSYTCPNGHESFDVTTRRK
jgi:putative metallohydrolase (TIGR04338 family)